MRRNSTPYITVESRRLRALITVKQINKGNVVIEADGRTYNMAAGDTLSLAWDEPVEEPLNADDRE